MSRVQRGNLHTQGLLSPNSSIGRCHHDPVRRRNIFYFLHEPCQLSTRHALVCVDTCRFVLRRHALDVGSIALKNRRRFGGWPQYITSVLFFSFDSTCVRRAHPARRLDASSRAKAVANRAAIFSAIRQTKFSAGRLHRSKPENPHCKPSYVPATPPLHQDFCLRTLTQHSDPV